MKKILLTTLLVLLSCTALVAQEEEYPSGVLISTRPQTLFFGADLGVEVPLNSNWSIGGEAIAHVWGYCPKNIAFKPSVKWYFWGTTGRGWYVRVTPLIGYFLNDLIYGHKYYGGYGVGVGWQSPFLRGSRWHFIGDIGIKGAKLFGGSKTGKAALEVESTTGRDNRAHFSYFTWVSPGSMFDFSIGVAYRF